MPSSAMKVASLPRSAYEIKALTSTSLDSDPEMRTTIAWLALWVPISWI